LQCKELKQVRARLDKLLAEQAWAMRIIIQVKRCSEQMKEEPYPQQPADQAGDAIEPRGEPQRSKSGKQNQAIVEVVNSEMRLHSLDPRSTELAHRHDEKQGEDKVPEPANEIACRAEGQASSSNRRSTQGSNCGEAIQRPICGWNASGGEQYGDDRNDAHQNRSMDRLLERPHLTAAPTGK
jgi:hypothetical protein